MSKVSTEVTIMSLKDTDCVCRSCTLKVDNSPGRREAKSSGHVVRLVLFQRPGRKSTPNLSKVPNTWLACRELDGV